jgi:hypothetical protein
VLGVGLAGAGAGELIAEGVLAVEMAALATDLRLSIHPHPTLSETLMEAAEVFFGESTRLPAQEEARQNGRPRPVHTRKLRYRYQSMTDTGPRVRLRDLAQTAERLRLAVWSIDS